MNSLNTFTVDRIIGMMTPETLVHFIRDFDCIFKPTADDRRVRLTAVRALQNIVGNEDTLVMLKELGVNVQNQTILTGLVL